MKDGSKEASFMAQADWGGGWGWRGGIGEGKKINKYAKASF